MRPLFLFTLFFLHVAAFAQVKKPTLMILPSDNWCNQRYFMTTFDDQGSKKKVPNYKQAFQEDTELAQVIAKIGALMIEKGYSLKDAEQELKKLEQISAEDNMTNSNANQAELRETPLDKLKKRAKSDVIIQVWWSFEKSSNGNIIRYTLDAFDAYTSKRIASSTGNTTTEITNKLVPDLILEAVKSNMPLFLNQIQEHFTNTQKTGREVILRIKTWSNWVDNLETEIQGKELNEYITEWIRKNAINGNYNVTDNSENFMLFEQVKIPLANEKGEGIDARDFLKGLQKHLKQAPFNINSKLMSRGLGEAILVLGEK